MSSPTPKSIRQPVVAGMFYPDDPAQCRREIETLFQNASKPDAPGQWIGALVPHAGWICSGQVAADAITWLSAARPTPDVIVVFGAVHTVGGFAHGAFDDHDAWSLPTGLQRLAVELQQKILASATTLKLDPRVHRREHSIEVNVPLIQHAWKDIPFLPIEVPPVEAANEIGRETAALLRAAGARPVFLASSDLTHYGPNYGITLAGTGQPALTWAADNDGELLDMMRPSRSSTIVQETSAHDNACGGGAIAAMLGACEELGATSTHVIRKTNSYEVLSKALGRQRADNFVGYAAAVVG